MQGNTTMAIYDGIYRWDGTKTGDREPIAWSPGAYNVRIFKRDSPGNIELLKPYVCLYSATGTGQSISANPEKFVKQLCLEFSLELERVLWVEDMLREEDRYEVNMFRRFSKLGNTRFYTVEKRKATDRELDMLEMELAGVGP
jgi:hypothetical protein